MTIFRKHIYRSGVIIGILALIAVGAMVLTGSTPMVDRTVDDRPAAPTTPASGDDTRPNAVAAATSSADITATATPPMHNTPTTTDTSGLASDQYEPRTALVAGGCFWCVEADAEKLDGVIAGVSGYSGGSSTDPTYETYADGGHREVVEVTYDPDKLSYRQLITYLIKHMDPTDGQGSFGDRGVEYSPAIYVSSDAERAIAERVLDEIAATGVYEEQLHVPVRAASTFYPAEEYHQNYYKKSAIRYRLYRTASGRDRFIDRHWGERADELPPKDFADIRGDPAYPPMDEREQSRAERADGSTTQAAPWEQFEKPSDEQLRQQLSDLQYRVTQRDATEPAFANAYWNNEAAGIYVDVVSGEPLFSSKHKYESGTGWPSFYKPLESNNIQTQPDRSLFTTRTEVRSVHADSHLGHVFEDGPEPTGLRYCMNSAALEFIPKEKMEQRGYGAYLDHFDE